MWIGDRNFPDSAYDQAVDFDGCLMVFNLPLDARSSYREALTEAIGNAYASNKLVFFLYDNDRPIEPPDEWVDLLEFGYAISPLQVICKGLGKASFSFSPEERIATLKNVAESILKFDRIKVLGKKFQAIGAVEIEGKQVSMPLTEVIL